MLRKLLVYAITTGLAAKLYRAWRGGGAVTGPHARRY